VEITSTDLGPSVAYTLGVTRPKPDHITDREDMRYCSAVLPVYRNPPALVGGKPRFLQVEFVGDALAARGIHHHVRRDPLAASEACDRSLGSDFDLGRLLAEAERDGPVAGEI
jgi:hypothetical protein